MNTLSEIPNEILLAPDQVKRDSQSRLPGAAAARQGFMQLMKEDTPRSYERAIVQGCYDGNAPFSQRKLKQDGQLWRCNLNFRGLEGTMDAARIPYYGLFSGVPQYANFKTRFRKRDPESQLWNTTVAENFTCLLNDWDQFKWHIQNSQHEMLFEGWGPLIFPDDSDWRFQSIPARAVMVPQGSPSCLDKRIKYIAVRSPYRVHELDDKIRDNEEGAASRGWNVSAVKNAIKFGTKSESGETWAQQPWEEWQKRYRDKSLISSYTECDVVQCVHLYVMEYTGKVSHFIITENSVPLGDKDQKDEEFLFKDPNRYDSYDQALNVAFQNTGTGTWHSVKGIGLKSYGFEETQNRLNCRVVDNAHISSGMVLQAGNATSKQKLQLMVTSAATIIPEGTTFVDHRLGGDIMNVMGVSRMLEAKLANKIGSYSTSSRSREDGRGEKATATEIEYAASKEGSLNSGQIDNYFNDLDRLYREVYRRALTSPDPQAKKFVQDCLDDGVPMEALENMEYVRANRTSGYGSPQMRKMAMQELMQLYPTLNERGKNNALNEMLSGSQGADKVSIFNPPMDTPDIDEAMAVLENNSLHDGEIPLVISGMDNVAHLDVHLQDAEQRLEPMRAAIEEGQEIDPAQLQQAYEYVSALGAHCEDHLSRIEGDPSRQQQVKLFEGKLKLLTSFHGKLRSAIRSAQAEQAQAAKEQQQAQALSALDQKKIESADISNQIKVDKWNTDKKVKIDKATTQNRLKTWQAGQDNTRKTIQVAEDVRLGRIETAADIQQKRMNEKKKNGSNGK